MMGLRAVDAYALNDREMAACRRAVRHYHRIEAAPQRGNGVPRAEGPCPDDVIAEVATDWRRRTELLQVVMRMVEEGER